MSDKDLLDPKHNDLIPRDPEIKDLMKSDLFPRDDDCPWSGLPAELRDNELLPRDGFPPPPKRVMHMGSRDLMSILTDAAEGRTGCNRETQNLGNGLTASSCPSGGLSIFKNGKQVIDRTELSSEDRAAMLDFLDRKRDKQSAGNDLIPREE